MLTALTTAEHASALVTQAGRAVDRLEPAAQFGAPKSYRELLGITWKLILATMILGLHKEIDTQILTPFLYTRVRCCGSEPGPPSRPAVQRPGEAPLPAAYAYGDHIVWLNVTETSCNCDLAKSYPGATVVQGSIAPCEVPWLAADDPLWSHSGTCRNYQYVQAEVNSVNNLFSVWQAVGALLLVPVCGKLADIYGRRPVFNVTTLMPCVAFLVFLTDALVGLSNGPIYFAGILLTVFLTHGPIGWSMLIDLIPDPVDQARFFPIFNAIQSGSISAICGDLLAYSVLMLHLDNFALIWGLLSAVAGAILVFIWLLMPETMAKPKRWQGWRVLARDVLPAGCCGDALGGRGTGSGGGAGATEPTDYVEGGADERDAPASSYLHAFTLWCKLPPPDAADGAEPPARASALQLSRQRVLQVFVVVVIVQDFQGGVGMMDDTFLLGHLHFLQEQKATINIFGKVVTVLAVPLSAWLLPRLGPYRALVLGGVLASLQQPLKVLPWCGSQCQAGPYLSTFCATVAGALSGPAQKMYLAAALRAADLSGAQSALLLLQTVLGNVSPMFFSAHFFGDREIMTRGYLLAAAMSAVSVAVYAVLLPRELPVRGGRHDRQSGASESGRPP